MQLLAALLAASLVSQANGQAPAVAGPHQSSVDRVVGLLKQMLSKSSEDARADDEAYAKFKCYCDTNLAEKKELIAAQTETVDQLGGEIEQWTGTAGGLTMEMQQIQTSRTDITEAKGQAIALRETEKKEYDETVRDLENAIAAMNQAIAILAEIGSDSESEGGLDLVAMGTQTRKTSFMAPSEEAQSNFVKNMKQALIAASAFLKPEDKKKVAAFLQQPAGGADFRGAYETQSGGILGVLRNMKETFQTELDTAKENENGAVEEHTAFVTSKDATFNELGESLSQKQDLLGVADDNLAAKKIENEQATLVLADQQSFVTRLRPVCEAKAKEYDYRKHFRVGEEAAIAKAIFILTSENAAKKLQRRAAEVSVAAPAAASFLQTSRRNAAGSALEQVTVSLRAQATKLQSRRLKRIAGLVANLKYINPFREGYRSDPINPYEIIFTEMDKMKKVMEEEAAVDKQQLEWCKHERTVNEQAVEEKTREVGELNTTVLNLVAVIEGEDSGLKSQIATVEGILDENRKEQFDQTAMRQEEFAAYKANVRDIQEEGPVLEEAIATLKSYFKEGGAPKLDCSDVSCPACPAGEVLVDSAVSHKCCVCGAPEFEAAAFLQKDSKKKERQPETPATWEDADMTKQHEEGAEVINMLEEIHSQIQGELQEADRVETEAQESYKQSMKTLKRTEDEQLAVLANLQMQFYQKKEELSKAREDVHASEKDKAALEDYLESIKPGCDFINQNFEMRENNRASEKKALDKAKEQIMAAPAYAASLEKERLGNCFETCKSTSGPEYEHVNCQACLNKVTVLGWCVSHPFTAGCEAQGR